MSEVDMDVDGRVHDGWQYRLKFEDGSVEHFRDRDALAAVQARMGTAKLAVSSGMAKTFEDVIVSFSGARGVEGVDADGKTQIGLVQGKGYALASKVVAVSYSATDGTEAPSQAFEAAMALLDVQRAALAQLAAGGAQEGTEGVNEALLGRSAG